MMFWRDDMTEEKWISMEEICKHLGSSRDTVKR